MHRPLLYLEVLLTHLDITYQLFPGYQYLLEYGVILDDINLVVSS